MSRGKKRLEEMRNNPRADWQISDVEVVCAAYGITLEEPSSGTHYKVKHERLRDIVTIPARRPIKPVYIRNLVAMVDELKDKIDEH
jgi:hypothetical protein